MTETAPLHIPIDELAAICRQYHVRELALFESVLSEEHGSDSDVDLLVSFEPAARITFTTLAKMQRELESLLGRKVDLVARDGLKPVIRDHVLDSARVLYAAEDLHTCQQEGVAEIEAAWEQEIQARVAAYRRGEEEVIDGETVLAELLRLI